MGGTMSPYPDPEDRPLIVIWEVTRSCALACNHCRAEAKSRRDPLELNGGQVERLLDQVEEINPQVFILTGGDPAMRPDILDIVTSATRRGLHVALSPSATPRLLNADFSAWRRAGVIRMSLSLDGATRETNDAFRGVDGAWRWTLDAMRLARRAGIEVQINTTFAQNNIEELEEFFRLIPRLMPKLWSIFLLVPTGRAKIQQMLGGADCEDLFERLLEFHRRSGIPVKTTEGPHFRRVALQQAGDTPGSKPWHFAPTNDGRGCVFVSHIGEIQPSGFLPIACGNVKCHNLLDVYRNAPVFRALRDGDRLKGKCGKCSYRNLCGGSRARAYAVTGDYLAAEPCCNHQPKDDSIVAPR